jgi:hypothetical protein
MFTMLSVPLCCLPTQAANPAATPIEATEAPMGNISSKTICGFFPLDSLYKGLRATKQQLEQDQLTRHISSQQDLEAVCPAWSVIINYLFLIESLENTIASVTD